MAEDHRKSTDEGLERLRKALARRRVLRHLWRYVKISLLAAGLSLYLWYFAGFSLPQSAFLAVGIWVACDLYADWRASAPNKAVFCPFIVSIRPNWYQLLSDFRLIHSDEEWHKLDEALAKVPTSEYRVFRSGMTFTVIEPPSPDPPSARWVASGLPGLTYSNNHAIFLSETVEFTELVMPTGEEVSFLGTPIREKQQHPFLRHPGGWVLPNVFFRPGMKGYDLGLEVHADWWQNLCQTGELGELAKIEADPDYRCGTTRLVIATLPYSEFGFYYEAVAHDLVDKQLEAMDKELQAHGWKRRKRDEDAEIGDPWSHADHEYFVVSHRAV